MKMRKRKSGALVLAAVLFTGISTSCGVPADKEVSVSPSATSALENGYEVKNPVIKVAVPPKKTSHGLSNPRNEDSTVTWDCVYFGNYWNNDTNDDAKTNKKDEKELIRWRVLSVDGDDAFLLADQNLDVQRYNDTYIETTWEMCTMRSWLNGYGADKNVCGTDYSGNNFLDNAFTESEQEAIKVTDVVNEDNPEYGTEGGNNTQDKVYLLSLSEALNPEYGFVSAGDDTHTREAVNTAYVAEGGEINCGGMESEEDTNDWWLRSPGGDSYYASSVSYYGDVDKSGSCVSSVDPDAVRPVLHLDLSADSEWKKAGTVSSTGGEMTAAWDCIWFGNYPQSDTAGETKEPIKWRVLSVDGDDAFLLADQNLDVQKYNNTDTDVTWETCTMRSWLNGYDADQNVCGKDYSDNNFLNNAFTESEQAAIKVTDVVNEDSPEHGTKGGNNTQDKVYLLSLSEVMNPECGFVSVEYETHIREAVNTAYVAEGGILKGKIESEEMGSAGSTHIWWLRSPGSYGGNASYISRKGDVDKGGNYVVNPYGAIRPVLHLNLSDTSVWTYAGTVSSTGEENELPAPTPSGSDNNR